MSLLTRPVVIYGVSRHRSTEVTWGFMCPCLTMGDNLGSGSLVRTPDERGDLWPCSGRVTLLWRQWFRTRTRKGLGSYEIFVLIWMTIYSIIGYITMIRLNMYRSYCSFKTDVQYTNLQLHSLTRDKFMLIIICMKATHRKHVLSKRIC